MQGSTFALKKMGGIYSLNTGVSYLANRQWRSKKQLYFQPNFWQKRRLVFEPREGILFLNGLPIRVAVW